RWPKSASSASARASFRARTAARSFFRCARRAPTEGGPSRRNAARWRVSTSLGSPRRMLKGASVEFVVSMAHLDGHEDECQHLSSRREGGSHARGPSISSRNSARFWVEARPGAIAGPSSLRLRDHLLEQLLDAFDARMGGVVAAHDEVVLEFAV